ncbi:MAG TPA: DUF916 domain-containing protein [Candidatus Paceibacterota bacterium]
MRKFAIFLIPSLLLLLGITVWAKQTSANSFLVSPAHKELEIRPGTKKTFDISLTNQSGKLMRFVIGSEDVVASDQGETNTLDTVTGPYSLRQYISVPFKEIQLEAGKTMSIPIDIEIPGDETNSGLYGAVTISAISEGSDGRNGTAAVLTSKIAVVVFVRTNEDLNLDAHLDKFDTASGSHVFTRIPVVFAISYKNSGSTHVRPIGTVMLRNIFGRTIEDIPVSSWFVLPMSTRSRTVQTNSGFLFGRYTVELVISGGEGLDIEKRKFSFWVLPWKYLFFALGSLITVIILRRIFMNLDIRIRP